MLLLRGYYRIHIAGNRVQLRNLFGKQAFDLPDVTGALLEALRPGDSARLWVKKTAIERPGPSGYVDVYALEGRDAGYLSLDEYNVQHKSTQARHIRLLWWSILGMALFTGWRYWVYRHTGYAYSAAVI